MRIFIVLTLLGSIGLTTLPAMYAGSPNEQMVSTHEPVYLSWKELRSAIKSEPAKSIAKRGKIHIRGSYLFINEPNKGIHVFDNGNPAAPKAVAFLNIPGNVDLAVRGDVLFADSFVDLVALDISALPAVKEINRQVDVFPYDAYQSSDGQYYYTTTEIDRTKGVIVGWAEKKGSK